jgi:DUF4097 and DUF4098 domain-containing protein YvlB
MKNRAYPGGSRPLLCLCTALSMLLFILGFVTPTCAYEKYVQTGTLRVSDGKMRLFTLRTPDNISGDIAIATWGERRVEVEYELTAKARSESEAKRFTEMVIITLDRDGDEVILEVKTPSRAPWRDGDRGLDLTLEVRLPEGMEIESRTTYFDLDLEGPFKDVTVDNDYGRVALRCAKGDISIRTSYGEIVLEEIEGELRAESSYGRVRASDIDSKGEDILLESSYGSITLEAVKGAASVRTSYGKIVAEDVDAGDSPLLFETSYGEIELTDVRGQISARTSYNPIVLSDAILTGGTNRLETSYGKISAEFASIKDSRLTILTKYSNIRLTLPRNTSAKMVATVDSGGSIHATNFPITPTRLDRTRLEGIAGGGESTIEMNIDGIGTIEVIGE